MWMRDIRDKYTTQDSIISSSEVLEFVAFTVAHLRRKFHVDSFNPL